MSSLLRGLRWTIATAGLLVNCLANGYAQAPQPRLYTIPDKEAPAPTYILTGRTTCALAWAPGAYKTQDRTWRIRLLDATTLTSKLEVSLTLEEGLELSQSEEAPDGLGVYVLLNARQHHRQLLLLYLRYQDGATESDRYTMPFDIDVDQMLVSPLGAYVRGISEASPIIFYLNPDTHQTQVLPFGPDKANRLTGIGLERGTGRLWLCLVRKGRNPGPLPSVVRLFTAGQPVADYPLQGFSSDLSPSTLYLADDTVGGLWVGTWGKRGSEFGQGPLAFSGFKAGRLPRFVDSARFWQFEPPHPAERHFARFSRRRSYALNNRFYYHGPVAAPGGGYTLAAERYFIRQSVNSSPFMSPMMGPFGYSGNTRMYETSFVVRMDFSPSGELRRLVSYPLPSQLYPDLDKRAVVLPDRPPLCLSSGAPKFGLPDSTEPGRTNWITLQPAALGMAPGQTVSIERFIQEGNAAYAFGQGKDIQTHAGYFFLSRLPEGR